MKTFLRFLSGFFFCLFVFQNANAQARATQNVLNTKPFIEIDVAGSSGTYNGQAYTEMHLGLNLNFNEYLTWRNAAFKRFGSTTAQETTGLDTSLRFGLDNKFDGGSVNLFAGPGYRFTSPSDKSALFAEAGATLHLGGLSVGAGAKYLRYDQAQYDSIGNKTNHDDLNYFITIAGGAGASF